MNKVKISEYAIEEIVSFLRKRLELTQDLIRIRGDVVPYNTYMSLCNKYRELIALEDEKIKAGEDVSTMEKEGVIIPMRRVYVEMLNDLKNTQAERVIFSSETIEEILDYARKSLSTYGIDFDYMSNENFFLRGVFCNLFYEMDENAEDYKKVNDLLDYFYSTENAGFNSEISGRIDVKSNGVITIDNHEWKRILKTGEYGEKLLDFIPKKDNVLVSSQIYVGYIYKDSNKIPTYLLLDKNSEYANAFIYDEEDYEVDSSKENDTAEIVYNLKTFVTVKGYAELYKDVYSLNEISKLIDILNNSISEDEDVNLQIDEIADVACNWWIDAIDHPTFDNGDTSDIGGFTMMFAMLNHAQKPGLSEESKQRFKEALKKRIKMELLTRRSFSLSVDYGPDRILSDAASEAGIIADFPWKTHMRIDRDKITVSCGYGAPYQTIFERDNTQDKDVKKLAKENKEEKKVD